MARCGQSVRMGPTAVNCQLHIPRAHLLGDDSTMAELVERVWQVVLVVSTLWQSALESGVIDTWWTDVHTWHRVPIIL